MSTENNMNLQEFRDVMKEATVIEWFTEMLEEVAGLTLVDMNSAEIEFTFKEGSDFRGVFMTTEDGGVAVGIIDACCMTILGLEKCMEAMKFLENSDTLITWGLL